jgi:serine/threonine protein phosphatase PrpC
MTAVLSLAYLTRLVPGINKRFVCCAGAVVCLLLMGLCGVYDPEPIPGLLLGGVIALFLPGQPDVSRRRSESGYAQVRLELAASVLSRSQRLLADVREYPIDEEALIVRAAERACGGCPCRNTCREEPGKLPTSLLHKPLGYGGDLPLSCRKSGRLLQELRRSQEQLRSIRADRDRREEYRAAVSQQYLFLSEYLQDLSDSLVRRVKPSQQMYQPEVAVCSASREGSNGDRCLWFAGVEYKYYILLCDGMGTGPEAAKDGKFAGKMLRDLLCAGFPPEYALRSVNSFCALQGRAGAVTIDLAELQLDTGKASLYKWGAAPSYILSRGEAIKIGTAAPPPGLSVTDARESVERLSLRRGEMLILLSDGAGGEESLRASLEGTGDPPGELAARILEQGRMDETDDATVAVVRLNSLPAAT